MDDHGFGMASVRFICGTQDLHRELETRLARLSGQGRLDPVRRLLRCQWRAVRALARPRGRRHLRRAEPRLDHRRHPPVQGQALSLCQFRHGRSGSPAESRPAPTGRAFILIATDGVFSMDGYLRETARDPRAGRPVRRAGHGRRLPRHRLHGAAGRGTPARAGVEVDILTGTLGKALGGALGRLYRRAAAGDRPAAPARAALSLLQRPAPRRGGRRLAALDIVEGGRRSARASCLTTPLLARGLKRQASRFCPANTRSFRSCWATPSLRRPWRPTFSSAASMSPASSSRSCRRGRPASARR
jgi:glycine C-acetyltransferase